MPQPTVPPALLVRQFLIDRGTVFGNNSGSWSSYVGGIPDDATIPDQAVGFIQTQSSYKGRDHRTGEIVERYGVHVRVRGDSDHEGTYIKAREITAALDGLERVTVTFDGDSDMITSIQRGSILDAGFHPDDNRRRHNFTVNLLVNIE
jgi:hypothetical protein